MNNYILSIMTEEHAKEICDWKYDDEYSVYNLSDWETVVQNNWELGIKEERETNFLSIAQNNQLVAYGVITMGNEAVLIGIGLKPSLCGKGLVKDIMKLLIDESKVRYPGISIALEVRNFNKRAIKCYENIGFVIKNQYFRDTLIENAEFNYMEYVEGE